MLASDACSSARLVKRLLLSEICVGVGVGVGVGSHA
jgi:hypothetical protein